jgi:hypothetical protein
MKNVSIGKATGKANPKLEVKLPWGSIELKKTSLWSLVFPCVHFSSWLLISVSVSGKSGPSSLRLGTTLPTSLLSSTWNYLGFELFQRNWGPVGLVSDWILYR